MLAKEDEWCRGRFFNVAKTTKCCFKLVKIKFNIRCVATGRNVDSGGSSGGCSSIVVVVIVVVVVVGVSVDTVVIVVIINVIIIIITIIGIVVRSTLKEGLETSLSEIVRLRDSIK